MRITNKIMQNNSLSNINNTKVAEDTLSTQVSSGKRVVRPSDDPIVAIRALRLRSSVTEIKQYYGSNCSDASSWLKTTEDAMQQVTEVLTNMVSQYSKGSNEYLETADREIIVEQLKALRDEVYSTGDADYAGRYVFTGYRTDVSLMFSEDTSVSYEITEQITAADLMTNTHVNTCYEDGGNKTLNLGDMQEGTVDTYGGVTEQNITSSEYHRIRLSYSECVNNTAAKPVIEVLDLGVDGKAQFAKTDTEHKNPLTKTIPADNANVEMYDSTAVPSPYDEISKPENKDKVFYLPDTGELLLGSDVYEELSAVADNALSTDADEGIIRVTYRKDTFKSGDLRPEHYFACTTGGKDGDLSTTGDNLRYNDNYLIYGAEHQVIEYDVGYNQRIRVNTTADEVFDPAIGRAVDDLIQMMDTLTTCENVVKILKEKLENATTDTEKEQYNQQLDAAQKAFDLQKEVVQKEFESGITQVQKFLAKANVAVTNCGARGSRLDLIKTRLSSQKDTFEELRSDNEDTDLSEAIVQLTSAQLTYEAALKATGKIMQSSLMDYI